MRTDFVAFFIYTLICLIFAEKQHDKIDSNSANIFHKTHQVRSNSKNHLNKKRHHHNHHYHRHHRPAIAHRQLKSDTFKSRTFRQSKFITIPDHWDKIPYIFQTYNEPENFFQMPALSNGFLGTTVKNNSVYVNGLYNGLNERSHRVRVPSMTAVNVFFSLETDSDLSSYHFDVRRGVYTVHTKNNEAVITQRFYVHRKLKNIIVNEIRVELLTKIGITIDTQNLTRLEINPEYINSPMNPNRYSYYFQENNPENITYEHRVIKPPTMAGKITELNDGIYYLQATIPQTEINNKRQKQVHTYYTNVPSKFSIYPNTTFKTFHLIQSIDPDNFRARNSYEEAVRMIQQDPNALYTSHVTGWEEIWQKAGIAMINEETYIDSNQESFKLAQRLYASFYNLYASLPLNYDNQFYGLSPSGLAYGGLKAEFFNSTQNTQFFLNRQLSEGYGGHVMYTQELWILPLISMFNQDMSMSIINSRVRRGYNTDHMNVYEQARELAREEKLEGVRYAWEQADYGIDVSPYQDAKKNKIHTSGDISFGIRSFLRNTHNKDFLLQSISSEASVRGEEYLNEIAKYWNDKFEIDPLNPNEFQIKRISFGERPQSREVDNDIFTNYIGILSMDTYKYALELTGKNPYDPQYSVLVKDYDEKIKRVKLPYDSVKKLYLEYDNFNSQQNEEAWAPFLNFPLQKELEYNQKKPLYDSYASQLQIDGKSLLSYASYVVGYVELNEEKRAQEYFMKMYNHFREPYMVMSEFPSSGNILNPQNTFNYLPGYAAYVTAFIAGFCGVRYRDYQLDLVYPSEHFGSYQAQVSSAQFPIFKPPTQNTESWNITGLMYKGNKLDIIYNLKMKLVEIRNRKSNDQTSSADNTLEIIIYEGTNYITKSLRIGDTIQINLSSELWTYEPKKSRLQKSHKYSDNMHILASVYSTQYSNRIIKPSNSAINFKVNFFFASLFSILVKLAV